MSSQNQLIWLVARVAEDCKTWWMDGCLGGQNVAFEWWLTSVDPLWICAQNVCDDDEVPASQNWISQSERMLPSSLARQHWCDKRNNRIQMFISAQCVWHQQSQNNKKPICLSKAHNEWRPLFDITSSSHQHHWPRVVRLTAVHSNRTKTINKSIYQISTRRPTIYRNVCAE